MRVCKFIVADQISKKGQHNGKTIFSTYMSGSCMFELDEPVPIIKPGSGCIGMGVPYELHISSSGTIIFYTEVKSGLAKSRDFLDNMYEAWLMSTNQAMDGSRARSDRDTQRTGMDAATRMMMGEGRTPWGMARDERPKAGQTDTLYHALQEGGLLPDDF